jgi:hypothetical protein
MIADAVVVYVERNSGNISYDIQTSDGDEVNPGSNRYLKLIGGVETVLSRITKEHERFVLFNTEQRAIEVLPNELKKRYLKGIREMDRLVEEVEDHLRAPEVAF